MLSLQFIGNIGGDCVIRDAGSGKAIGFSVGTTKKYTDAQGNKVEKTTWINCTIWKTEKQGTKIADYLRKGVKVYVEGEPSSNSWIDKDGKAKSDIRCKVDKLELLSAAKNSNESNSQQNDQDNFTPATSGDADDLPF